MIQRNRRLVKAKCRAQHRRDKQRTRQRQFKSQFKFRSIQLSPDALAIITWKCPCCETRPIALMWFITSNPAMPIKDGMPVGFTCDHPECSPHHWREYSREDRIRGATKTISIVETLKRIDREGLN